MDDLDHFEKTSLAPFFWKKKGRWVKTPVPQAQKHNFLKRPYHRVTSFSPPKLAEAGDKERMEKEQLDEALKEVWDLWGGGVRSSFRAAVVPFQMEQIQTDHARSSYCFEAAAQAFSIVEKLEHSHSPDALLAFQ